VRKPAASSQLEGNAPLLCSIQRALGLPDVADWAPLSGGQVHQVFRIGDDLVLKVEGDLPFVPKCILHYQVDLTTELLAAGVRVPRIFECAEIAGRECLLFERIEGALISEVWKTCDASTQRRLVEKLGEQMQLIHSLKRPALQVPVCAGRSTNSLKSVFCEKINFERPRQLVGLPVSVRRALDVLEENFERIMATLPGTCSPVVVHGDLSFGNALCEEGDLTAIIDFDWHQSAPAEFELWRWVAWHVERGADMHQPFVWLQSTYPQIFASEHILSYIRLQYTELLLQMLTVGGPGADKAHHTIVEAANLCFSPGKLERLLAYD
jgi:aminoglycoside phosphotransferase (APT) family kinase protein